MFAFDSNKLSRNTILGKGPLGTIYPYQSTNLNKNSVVKVISTPHLRYFAQLIQQISINIQLEHSAVLPVKGFDVEKNHSKGYTLYIQMPWMQKTLQTLLNEHITSRNDFSENSILRNMYALITGLEYLHSKKIVHGNIKASNILFNEYNQPKFTDIGMLGLVESRGSLSLDCEGIATLPEIGLGSRSIEIQELISDDLWQIGVLMLELCLLRTGVVDPRAKDEQKEKIIQQCLKEISTKYSERLVGLIAGLLGLKSAERRTASQMKEQLETALGISKMNGTICFSDKNIGEEQKAQKVRFAALKKEDMEEIIKGFDSRNEKSFEFASDDLFKIKPLEAYKVTDRDVKRVITEVKTQLDLNFKELRALDLNLTDCFKITDQTAKEVVTHISSKFPYMQQLSISFGNCWQLSTKGAEAIVTNIESEFRSLKYISLSFEGCPNISAKTKEAFALRLRFWKVQVL